MSNKNTLREREYETPHLIENDISESEKIESGKLKMITDTINNFLKRDSEESKRSEKMDDKTFDLYQKLLEESFKTKNDPNASEEQRKKAEQDYLRIMNEMKDIRNHPTKVQIIKYLTALGGIVVISGMIIICKKRR